MAKKLTRKEKIALQQEEAKNNPQPSAKKSRQPKVSSQLRRNLAFIVAALAFLLYANTLGHSWALDDYSLIKENTMTRKGTSAIGEILRSTYRAGYFNMDFQLYRPLSKVFFAIEWEMSPDNPAPGHWINVLLYALTGFLLFYSLTLYLRGNLIASFLAASLFIAHPIHTEVVANIKSLDEILCFLMFVVTSIFVHRYVMNKRTLDLVLACAAYFLALLSKESAVTFLAVIPLMIWFFTDQPSSRNLTTSLVLAGIAALYLLIRMRVIGNSVKPGEVSVVDNLLAAAHGPERLATAVMIMGMYLKLFFFPHPLISDYSFRQIPVVGFGNIWFLLSLAIYAALGFYAITRFKKKDPVAFGILYFFITASVASNILMLIGTSFGERLMYTPSFGFCLAIGVLIDRFFNKSEEGVFGTTFSSLYRKAPAAFGILAVVIALYSFKTVTRNRDWKDNLALYEVDVVNAPNSARTHYYLGNYISQDEYIASLGKDSVQIRSNLDRAIVELNKATEIYPQFADAWQQLGKIYLQRKDFKKADEYYQKAISINPQNPLYLNNYGNVLFNIGRLDDARKQFEEAIRWNPDYAHAYNNLASVYGAFGENFRAQKNEAEAIRSFETAISYFKKAIEKDPEYATPYRFIGITYQNIGDANNAKYYLDQYNVMMAKGAKQ